ncbi:MAG: hypothetical protein U0840_01235 [Gemmataceae bacterium]
MAHLERHNRRCIDELNQRSGRTLSIIDLIRAGTLTSAMAAHALQAIESGASLLTAAKTSGAGKTALMAGLLQLLPPGEPIITLPGKQAIDAAHLHPPAGPTCYLAHEIGTGGWYSYLWGEEASRFLSLAGGNRRVASCIHADDLEELTAIIQGSPLSISRELLDRVGLILFIHLFRTPGGHLHRVTAFHLADAARVRHHMYTFDAQADQMRAIASPPGLPYPVKQLAFIEQMVMEGVVDYQKVRRKVIQYYTQADGLTRIAPAEQHAASAEQRKRAPPTA